MLIKNVSGRTAPLATGEFYHIFNRSIASQPTFLDKLDFKQALLALSYYRFKNPPIKLSRFKEFPADEKEKLSKTLKEGDKLVEIVAFVLMPNHFHFLLKQKSDHGITIFLSKFTNSYTRFFNIRHERVGDLFQGVFKAVRIENDEQLLHLSRYIHLNPLVSFVVKETNFLNYQWSSLPHYLKAKSDLIFLDPVLDHFPSPPEYEKFVLDQADYGRKLEQIKHMVFENI